PPGHCESIVQPSQVSPLLQIGVGFAHCMLLVHCTHSESSVSQTGVPSLQAVSSPAVHWTHCPATWLFMSGAISQAGFVASRVAQAASPSIALVHGSHIWLMQIGAAGMVQSASQLETSASRHWTHLPEPASHTVPAPQSSCTAQETQVWAMHDGVAGV